MYLRKLLVVNKIILIRPSKLYKDKILAFKEEFCANDEIISGGELLDKLDFDEWIEYVQRNSDINTVSGDWVLTDMFFACEDDEFVGVIAFRHKLNDFLKDWGHVGYSVKPSCRGNKIATFMLSKIVDYAGSIGLDSLQLSCYEDNVASSKTILNNGGKFVRSFKYLDKKVNVYIIELDNIHNSNLDLMINC